MNEYSPVQQAVDLDETRLRRAGNYLRYLALEAIEMAQSGHPGLPLGCADLAVLLYRHVLRHDPSDPCWSNRDRLVLSAGHGSMLLYGALYMSGYPLTREDLSAFRALGSRTPGHPERDPHLGIETSTGPLGQGAANAVGLALEARRMEALFNPGGDAVYDNHIWALLGDGCMMEGISAEAASLAGHWGLDNLTWIYDSNHITIDGDTNLTFTESVRDRFLAMGWEVETVSARDLNALYRSLTASRIRGGKPHLVIMESTIGEGLETKAGTSGIHGSPAGLTEWASFVRRHSWLQDLLAQTAPGVDPGGEGLVGILKKRVAERPPVLEDAESLTFMRDGVNGKAAAWQARVEARGKADADWAGRHCLMLQGPALSPVFGEELLRYRASSPKASTRNLAGDLLKRSISGMPALLGGSADLACSTKATLPGEPYFAANQPLGRNLAFGIREHAMGAIGNGLALSGWHLPFTSTFLSFFDYMKTPVRLAALMNLSHLFVFSHDSLHVGEDGPTHQPVEHLNSMRLIPRLRVVRPCNDQETAWAFLRFFQEGGATALVTTRQDLPMIRPQDGADDAEGYRRFRSGAYVMADLGSRPAEVVFCASGSEVSLAMSCAQALLDQSGVPCRVVSIPCLEDFAAADGAFRSELLLAHQRRLLVHIEAASYRAVDAFSPADLLLIDIQSFGESGPAGAVAEAKGFSVTAVLERIRQRIALN